MYSRHTTEFLPEERQQRKRGEVWKISSVKMAAQSPTDQILPQWKKAGKQGKEMTKPEDEKKAAAVKITESAK